MFLKILRGGDLYHNKSSINTELSQSYFILYIVKWTFCRFTIFWEIFCFYLYGKAFSVSPGTDSPYLTLQFKQRNILEEFNFRFKQLIFVKPIKTFLTFYVTGPISFSSWLVLIISFLLRLGFERFIFYLYWLKLLIRVSSPSKLSIWSIWFT
jgi:hypothetical protein